MAAPAGLGRIEFPEVSVSAGITDNEPSGCVAAVMPLRGSGFSIGAGGGWNNSTGTGTGQLSGCYVVTGDPIGFMEGLFGPSITLGASAKYQYADSTSGNVFDVDGGFQFSLFPSFALGMACTDIIHNAVLRTGFSHVFNRSLKIHASYGDDTWQCGAELTVSNPLRVYSGTDGNTMNAGLSITSGEWKYGYGAILHESSIEHRIGVAWRFP
jgi:hypothetical protein